MLLLAFTIGANAVDPVGLWEFDNASDLTKATVGIDLTWTGSPSASTGINAGDGAAYSPIGTYLTAANPIGANGGGTRTNEYTLLIDLKVPAFVGWSPVFETSTPGGTSSDGDYWLSTSRGLGVSSEGYVGYVPGSITADTWFRLVVSVDQGTRRSTYVNGALVGNHFTGGTDGRWTLASTFSAFGDNTASERNNFHVSNIALFDGALTGTEIAALGIAGSDILSSGYSIAWLPTPFNGSTGLNPNTTTLNWNAPDTYTGITYNIYFGTTVPDDQLADYGLTLLNPDGPISATTIDPSPLGDLDYNTTYHWVVDSIKGGTIVYDGDPWSFTTQAPFSGQILTNPYLQDAKQDGMTIMWELSGLAAACSVEYGLDASYGQTAATTNATSTGGSYIYKSVITGLDAGTTYHYRTVIDGTPGSDQIFTTAPVGYANFSFGAWSDSQGNSAATFPMMAHMGQNVDIAISTGDMAEDGGSYSSVATYFLDRVAANLGPASVPYYVAWGNHCNYSGGTGIKPFAGFPASGNYSFDYAGCHFVCIDDNHRTNYAWVESDLIQAVADNARFIFLFVHRPPYCERWISGDSGFQANLVPLMEQYGVDICFSGHTHEYARGYLNGVYYCMTGGGSWLDHSEPLIIDWAHMTVGGYTSPWPGINGGLLNEYVRIDIDEFGFTSNMIPFYSDGTLRANVSDTFSKTDILADIVPDGKVNMLDFSLLASHWNESCAGGECNNADVNGNGEVNTDDLAIIAASWLIP